MEKKNNSFTIFSVILFIQLFSSLLYSKEKKKQFKLTKLKFNLEKKNFIQFKIFSIILIN